MLLIDFLEWIEDCSSIFTMFISQVKEINNLADSGILDNNHLLCQILQQSQEASFSVEPGISVQFLLDWLQGFYDSSHAEIIVGL